MKTIMYIHGFGSTFDGLKKDILSKHFNVIGVTLQNKPKEDIVTLEKMYEEYQPDIVLGTSLGAFYSTYLHSIYDCKMVCINPVTTPSEQLKYHLGKNTNYITGEEFEFTQDDLDFLKSIEYKIQVTEKMSVLQSVFYCNKDEKINPTEIKKLYKYSKIFEYNCSDHRFMFKFGDVIKFIMEF